MRKSRVIAFVVASLVSTASFAGAQSTAAPGAQAGRHAMRGGMKGERDRDGVLRGIKLSDAEKASLKGLRGKYATEGKELRASLQPAIREARSLRQKGDTAGARAVLERNKDSIAKMKALRERREADIRAALTPDNQKLFDANLKRNGEHRGEQMERRGERMERRGDRMERGGRKRMKGMNDGM